MASGAAQMMFQCVFEGSIVMQDSLIERRPYHRNCDCALHKLKGACSSACSRAKNLSFPKKQPGSECSLSLSASKFSSLQRMAPTVVGSRKDDVNAALHTHSSQNDKSYHKDQYC